MNAPRLGRMLARLLSSNPQMPAGSSSAHPDQLPLPLLPASAPATPREAVDRTALHLPNRDSFIKRVRDPEFAAEPRREASQPQPRPHGDICDWPDRDHLVSIIPEEPSPEDEL